MNIYTDMNVEGYERVVYCENEQTGLKAWIAIHSTKLGPSLGGCRMWNYNNKDDALFDVLRLSKGMTYKNALAGLSLGGGKSVIWGDSKTQKTPELLESMGEFVEYLGGRYIIAEDVGISVNDMMTVHNKTMHAVSKIAGDPGPFTALGVYIGIKAACQFKYGTDDLSNINVHVQGAGSVGLSLINRLVSAGAHVIVTDINQDALEKASALGAIITETYKATCTSFACDVFAPCALGAVINDTFLDRMRYKIIAGSANNQLLEDKHGIALHNKGIIYAPDYVINAGGVIMVSGDYNNGVFDRNAAYKKVNNIGNTLTNIFEESTRTNTPTFLIANRIAESIFV